MGNANDPLPSSEWVDPLDLSDASISSSSSFFCDKWTNLNLKQYHQ